MLQLIECGIATTAGSKGQGSAPGKGTAGILWPQRNSTWTIYGILTYDGSKDAWCCQEAGLVGTSEVSSLQGSFSKREGMERLNQVHPESPKQRSSGSFQDPRSLSMGIPPAKGVFANLLRFLCRRNRALEAR